MTMRNSWFTGIIITTFFALGARAGKQLLPDTQTLQPLSGELRSEMMLAGIDAFLDDLIAQSIVDREKYWQRDYSSAAAYTTSVAANQVRLSNILGVLSVDQRVSPVTLEFCTMPQCGPEIKLAETSNYTIYAVRWRALRGIYGSGLYLRPRLEQPRARVIVVPDADQTPELLTGLEGELPPETLLPLKLVLQGCEVIVPALADRDCKYAASERFNIRTNLSHREWIYRMTFTLGRHIIGYELQKLLALSDWMSSCSADTNVPLAIAGYGEGGMLALYAAAIDPRFKSVLVSGYLCNRNRVWEEPIYRNVFGLLREFGDAEILSLILPRSVVVEHTIFPSVDKTGDNQPGMRNIAAPGLIRQPEFVEVAAECERVCKLGGRYAEADLKLVNNLEQDHEVPFFSPTAVQYFCESLQVSVKETKAINKPTRSSMSLPDNKLRQERIVAEMQQDAQQLVGVCEYEREQRFWQCISQKSVAEFAQTTKLFRQELSEEIIGSFQGERVAGQAYSTLISSNAAFHTYDVVIDTLPGVFAWGHLLLPSKMRSDYKYPVVVCQHGLESLPFNCITEDPAHPSFKSYKGYAAKLVRSGYIVFVPHNPYRGFDKFRMLQRKLNPLGKTLFSIIIEQHRSILEWLGTLDFVDSHKIGFYGLSYGGKSAMRIPAVLDGYALSICSGDYNDWIRKVVGDDLAAGYLFTKEWEIGEWNLGRTFNYAEMAALIAPRPFMVERGRYDGCGRDHWIAWEYAKVDNLYDELNIRERTAIEYFKGPHTINGKLSFDFLGRYLLPEKLTP